ncbi:signal recognition particle-docking protein FtsY [Brevibacterium jeotgali]|uniref:Signal recognition particle receptor FtsY n=1 Tax=Brevibacterium jeotgali TaxID=1262550 RepID=A0A2H1L3G8_9MICO|nr:signal recognition particle-docking protein FtsY [Brevibacterium jeotgali]TWC02473.1 signal recognition particle-docking protein FtsY [Brevibacterium jeotgali]SMY11265.1 signal recognition particle-docking protein FtsY [Brevibacterium jeotgali]
MESVIYAGIGVLVLLVLIVGAFLLAPSRRRRRDSSAPATVTGAPGPDTGPGEAAPGDADDEPAGASAPVLETPTEPTSRLARLRDRLSKSNTTLGRGLLTLLSRETLDEQTWEEIEDLLIMADIGVDPTTEIVDALRERVRVLGTRDPQALTELLREEMVRAVDPTMDRTLAVDPIDGSPRVVLVVGVNGSGKTTTVGKIARVLVAQDRSVLLGAADTFRAAAAEQLSTWGSRVGVETVRKEEGADPASVAFSAVERGIAEDLDVVMIDTAGRLQNKKGLMDELGKVKRVAARPLGDDREIDEVLLVLDATTGQNGLQQAKVFSEAVNITGIVLTKLDGTAKGGIVVAVQRTLGVPVKLIGLGEGADDLAPFDAHEFVDAIVDG